MHEEEEANLLGSVRLEGLLDGNKVFERLGHLASLDVEMPRMEKVVYPLVRLEEGLGLGQLVVMVGKPKILSSRVDV